MISFRYRGFRPARRARSFGCVSRLRRFGPIVGIVVVVHVTRAASAALTLCTTSAGLSPAAHRPEIPWSFALRACEAHAGLAGLSAKSNAVGLTPYAHRRPGGARLSGRIGAAKFHVGTRSSMFVSFTAFKSARHNYAMPSSNKGTVNAVGTGIRTSRYALFAIQRT